MNEISILRIIGLFTHINVLTILRIVLHQNEFLLNAKRQLHSFFIQKPVNLLIIPLCD